MATTTTLPDMIDVRDAKILTTSYVASDNIANEGYNQLCLSVGWTKGSLTSFQAKIEYSDDGVIWRQYTVESISSGTITPHLAEFTTTVAGVYDIRDNLYARYFRVSVKGTGTVTGSSCTVKAYLFSNNK